jgi:hypothetical protein
MRNLVHESVRPPILPPVEKIVERICSVSSNLALATKLLIGNCVIYFENAMFSYDRRIP